MQFEEEDLCSRFVDLLLLRQTTSTNVKSRLVFGLIQIDFFEFIKYVFLKKLISQRYAEQE